MENEWMNKEKWTIFLNEFKIKKNITNQAFSTFLSRVEFVKIEDNTIYTTSISQWYIDYITEEYQDSMEEFASEKYEQQIKIIISIEANNAENKIHPSPAANNISYMNTNLDSDFTFENFVVGPNNQYAHAAALASAISPSVKYNPLFLYGETGLGKTHLLHAIGNLALEKKPYIKILYIETEKFLNEMIQSLAKKQMDSFRLKYRKIDILLVDDIHFLAEKMATQEEFFNTFNELYSSKKQIIMTSDRPPKELQNIEDRLKSRFESGLLSDITSPHFETKMAILLKKLEMKNLTFTIPNKILSYIANLHITNIRQLEGCLNKIVHFMEIDNNTITLEKAMELLRDIVRDNDVKMVTIKDIITLVTKSFNGITEEELKSPTRTKQLTQVRHIIMYLARHATNLKTSEIGEYFNRDHATVTHATKVINNQIRKDKSYHEMINNFLETLTK